MGNVFAYPLEDRLYLNLTNQCPNRCVFCIRNNEKGVGYDLWLDREPSAEEVLAAAGDVSAYREVVFCGYGEPLIRWEVVVAVAGALKARYGVKIRVNTNGLAEAFLKQRILPRLQGLVDTISISLNAADADTYDRLCHSCLGPEAYPALLSFIRESKVYIPRVVVSVVEIPGFDPEPARKLAEELGVELRIRSYLQE
ncbi:MAG TPA: radical SAM protein [Firmicutes bacterium]|jgi:TatD family-associated radical SAM protein|nr:radical SAM protein [Bacillota bacterium]